MKMKKLVFFIVCLLVLTFYVSLTLAEVPDSADWYGTVSIDANATPIWATVGAMIDGVVVATTTVGSGQGPANYYLIHIPGSSGDTIRFQVYGINVTTDTWTNSPAIGTELNLTANKSAADVACSYSLGCSGGYCCSGATEITDGSATGTCQATACSTAGNGGTTGGGGGGGGGGGAAVTTTATSETVNTGRINNGGTANAIFTSEDLIVTGVDITVIKTVTASTVTVINMGESRGIATNALTPEEEAASMHARAYIKITAGKIANTNIAKAVIKFRIKKSAGYDPSTIELRRYDGVYRVWSSLTTTLVRQDFTYYYYEAETPGFSIFAVVGKKLAITMMELLDMVRSFYAGTSAYTMMEILDQIRIFYGG